MLPDLDWVSQPSQVAPMMILAARPVIPGILTGPHHQLPLTSGERANSHSPAILGLPLECGVCQSSERERLCQTDSSLEWEGGQTGQTEGQAGQAAGGGLQAPW